MPRKIRPVKGSTRTPPKKIFTHAKEELFPPKLTIAQRAKKRLERLKSAAAADRFPVSDGRNIKAPADTVIRDKAFKHGEYQRPGSTKRRKRT